MLNVILKAKKLLEHFAKNNKKQKAKRKEFRIEKAINYMPNSKVMITHLIVGLIKKTA